MASRTRDDAHASPYQGEGREAGCTVCQVQAARPRGWVGLSLSRLRDHAWAPCLQFSPPFRAGFVGYPGCPLSNTERERDMHSTPVQPNRAYLVAARCELLISDLGASKTLANPRLPSVPAVLLPPGCLNRPVGRSRAQSSRARPLPAAGRGATGFATVDGRTRSGSDISPARASWPPEPGLQA